ncbi:DUF3187 family protein [Congregibacter brevis]|uniref:DUF3187 family protein n=1 Tax=Congregibacter brevis TaxID=3081201 RepID=A0ABZ0I8Q5_9GAMM|nr:DUF3187 family protein [Congregibacter sp. IMCC45268]
MMSTLPHCPRFWRYTSHTAYSAAVSFAAFTASPALSDEALTGPIASRNLSPLYANLGIPVLVSAASLEAGVWDLDWTLHWASHSVRESSTGRSLELDGETRRHDFRIQRGLGKGVAVSLNVPYVSHSAGKLDGLIDGWHAFWGMPDGPRGVQEDNRLRYAYSGSSGFEFQSERSSIGDIELGINVELIAAETWTLGALAQYKFDTGSAEDFSGSGDSGASLGVRWSWQSCFSALLSCHVQAGFTEVGGIGFDPKADTVTPFAGLSIGWQFADSLALLAQVDSHGAVYDAQVLRKNGPPVWGTLGLRWQPLERWLIDAQFVEDLAVGSAPDVSFRFALSHSF